MALIKCEDCRKEISDKASACIHCGCPIILKRKCNECGKEINDNDKVCSSCGCPIEEIKIKEKVKSKKPFEELSKEEKQLVYTKYRNKTDGKKLGLVIGLIAFIILLTFIMPIWLCFISLIALIVLVLNLDKKEAQSFYEENDFDFNNIKTDTPTKNEEKIKPNKILLCLGGIMGAFGGLTFLINIGDGIEEAMLPLIILIVGGILLMLAFKKNK